MSAARAQRMQDLASGMEAEARRLAEDAQRAAAGRWNQDALEGDVQALSRIVKLLKKELKDGGEK